VTWLIHTCDMTHSHVWHDPFIPVKASGTTCLHVTSRPFISRSIHLCHMNPSYMWNDWGLIGVSIWTGSKFVLLKCALQSTSSGRVSNRYLVPVKTGWLSRAIFYSIFPVNQPLLYQAVGVITPQQTHSTRYDCWIQGGQDPQDALSCMSFSAKEPIIVQLFCGKWPIKIRHPMHRCQMSCIPRCSIRISIFVDAAPTAAYKRGRITGNIEYKLALLSQTVFDGTRIFFLKLALPELTKGQV